MNLRVVISLIDELSDVSSSTYGLRKVRIGAGKKLNNVSCMDHSRSRLVYETLNSMAIVRQFAVGSRVAHAKPKTIFLSHVGSPWEETGLS